MSARPKFTFGQKVTDGKIVGMIRHREWNGQGEAGEYSYLIKPDDRSIRDVIRMESELDAAKRSSE